MVKERLPPLSLINKDNIDAFRQVDDTVILAYLDEDDDWLYEVYAEVASERHKDFVFGITNDYDLAAHHNLSVPSVVAYKRRDNDHKSLTGQFDKTTMETFLRVATPLLIGEITKRNIQDYVGVSHLPLPKPRYVKVGACISLTQITARQTRRLHLLRQRKLAHGTPPRAHARGSQIQQIHQLRHHRLQRVRPHGRQSRARA